MTSATLKSDVPTKKGIQAISINSKFFPEHSPIYVKMLSFSLRS
jgi:hypothetical protein